MDFSEQIPQGQISVVIPTSGRHEVLRETLPSYFSQWGLAEIILVNDSYEPLRPWFDSAFPSPPLPVRIVDHPRNLGPCAARNSGIRAAKSAFVMMGEDDVILCNDHIKTLFSEYNKVGADVISGVFYRLLGDDTIDDARRRQRLDSSPIFDVRRLHMRPAPQLDDTTEVLYTHALLLMKRELALAVLYSTVFGGPSFERDDNDFCLAARRLGARIFICPHAEAIHLPRTRTHGSGIRGVYSLATTAFSMVTNNSLFIEKYFDIFQDAGYRGSRLFLKTRVGLRSAWDVTHRYLESENMIYEKAVRVYRMILRVLRLR